MIQNVHLLQSLKKISMLRVTISPAVNADLNANLISLMVDTFT